MDTGGSLLSQMLLETMTPVVMVLPTPLAEKAFRKNNLNLVQILHPFCICDKIDVPVRTASDQPYRLQKFKLRLFYASEICQPPVQSAEDHLTQVVENASDKAFAEIQENPQELEVVRKMADSESLSSWLQVYNKEFIHTLSFSEHEAFDHPVACLLLVSSKDENPVNKFVDLFNTNQLPSLLNEGAMDPKILKHYVLIHDNQDAPADKANEILQEMKATFGPNDCKLLTINSLQMDEDHLPEDIWSPFISPSLVRNSMSDNILGHFLNKKDLEEMNEFMQELSVKHIIPYMEQKIRSLNQQVLATRRGLKNQIKNLWWRKGKDDTSDVSNGPLYTFSSIESQIRVLGDYAFMLHDYELALANYRLLSSDYKIDKAWKRYAGVQEMIGFSLFMLDQSRKEAEYSMETAFAAYQKTGIPGQRYATRCALWWAEMHKARGQFKDAANIYLRTSSEEPNLRAGVLLEQAAYCFLRAKPSMLRKFGFHLVLAGNRYNICGQRKHAVRAYMSVISVFDGNGWKYIGDHVHFNLGRWYAILGKADLAIEHFMSLLPCSHQPTVTQETFLKDFLQIFQSLGKRDEMLKLDLPIINMQSLQVHFQDHRTYASPEAAVLPEKIWQTLEEGLVPSMPSAMTNWLESATKSSSISGKGKDRNVCIAGEMIDVELEFKNPLEIPLNISSVSLICNYVPETMTNRVDCDDVMHESEDISEHALANQEARSITANENTIDRDTCSLILSEEAFTLKGGQSMVVHLKATPKKEGFLDIVGVKWLLSGTVMVRCDFVSEIPMKKRTKGRIKDSMEHPHKCLNFSVLQPLPRLEGTIHQMPTRTSVGELRRLVLELSNRSATTIKDTKLKINHPRFLIVGNLEDLDAEFPFCLETQQNDKIDAIRGNGNDSDIMTNSSNFIFTFPKDFKIEGGSTILWPLWLHTGEAGNVSLNISIYYETEKALEQMTYRTLRMHYDVQVVPSLDLSVHIIPCPSKLQEFLLRLDILNQNNSESFWLRQISSVGMQWKLASLQPSSFDINACDNNSELSAPNTAYLSASVCPSQLLPPGQALSLFFKLMKLRQDSSYSDTPEVQVQEYGVVDLILTAEQQDEAGSFRLDNMSDIQRITSHHICNCSVASHCPIWWIMEGPKSVLHDFSSVTFCEIKFYLSIRNCSNESISIKIETSDNRPKLSQASESVQASAMQTQSGWHDVSLETDGMGKAISDPVQGPSIISSNELSEFQTLVPCCPFMWCSLSSTNIKELGSWLSVTVPLSISVFAPGIYDLSNYRLIWKLHPDINGLSTKLGAGSMLSANRFDSFHHPLPNIQNEMETASSGVAMGHPFLLTVLQSS
ncbi:uncharacterized protein LOC131036088 isoform X2 [Cryptomeria japonica]|uniref:uncharacterized protein LOC131036088 isoform X2 n=1 Tax=Cryptomeria japonica TaxID=3369 RepID=UPI0027DA70A0|nr:uncharacterized protein LOC131036088 isoform X2 [Cryptomeria japonica]